MLTNPCNLSLNPQNTGIECSSAMSATAMVIMVPRNATWTQADIDASPYLGSFTSYVEAKIHATGSQRWFPLGGFAAPISSITESNENDVIETLDNGSSIFVRYGKYNRTFATTAGGLCFAAHLMRFPQGYSFIEVDQDGKVQVYEPTDGVYAGIPLIMFKGLGPTLATFSTVYKNRFMMTFDPVAYIEQGKIFASDSTENILGLNGLLDTIVTTGTQAVTYTPGTAGTATVTITAVGANADTIAIVLTEPDSTTPVNISGIIDKTSSETTVTLLAAKIKDGINAQTMTNGGYTATNLAGVITVTAPASIGAAMNGVAFANEISGTITETDTAFTGATDGTANLFVGVFTECADTDLVSLYTGTGAGTIGQPTNFLLKDSTGVAKSISAAVTQNGEAKLTSVIPVGVYTVGLNTPAALMANGIEGYEGVKVATITVSA